MWLDQIYCFICLLFFSSVFSFSPCVLLYVYQYFVLSTGYLFNIIIFKYIFWWSPCSLKYTYLSQQYTSRKILSFTTAQVHLPSLLYACKALLPTPIAQFCSWRHPQEKSRQNTGKNGKTDPCKDRLFFTFWLPPQSACYFFTFILLLFVFYPEFLVSVCGGGRLQWSLLILFGIQSATF